ncbi:MAG: hypothetical protein K2I91_04755, partial [Muribaculaceae bacterium]|nr:hypothetical protein [Muribaculaceae bacterium]
KIAAMYETLVEEIRTQSPGTQLYIQRLLPINNDFKRYKNLLGREKVVPRVNELLPSIAERHGAEYVDLWPAFADEEGKLSRAYTTDGLHLSGAGYKRWAEMVRPLLDNNSGISTGEDELMGTDSSSDDSSTETSSPEMDIQMPVIINRVE